jgi:hypothetical protein
VEGWGNWGNGKSFAQKFRGIPKKKTVNRSPGMDDRLVSLKKVGALGISEFFLIPS